MIIQLILLGFGILYTASCILWILRFSGQHTVLFQKCFTVYLFLDALVTWICYIFVPSGNFLFDIASIECGILQIPLIFVVGKDFSEALWKKYQERTGKGTQS